MAKAAEGKLEEFAEDLGKLLGQAQSKAENWLGQRKVIADHLITVRDTAARLLAQLGVAPAAVGAPGARKQTAKTKVAPAKTGRRRKRTMSAEARAKIAAAQRARWARQKGQK